MQMRRAVKCLVALACSLAALGMASAVGSHMVNYRGQPQEDLTCMQASTTLTSGEVLVYRNDPSTNCFGFPSLQFDTAPIEGGKPNGITIDWSLMVDELQMQDDDRINFHLPGFTGGHNTFGIMGSSIDTAVDGNGYTPNFESEAVSGDAITSDAIRADFGALVGIWGISCGTEKNLYMDRAKVDNLRTAEWDPSREMLKFVLKARRYGGISGRHDGYIGTRSFEFGNADSLKIDGTGTNWVTTTTGDLGKSIAFSRTSTDPKHDTTIGNVAPSNEATITVNDQSLRGSHLQAMEYSFEGPRDSTHTNDLSVLGHDGGLDGTTNAKKLTNYKNDGYIYAPGNRVCGIYVDPTKLHRGQQASNDANGLGPLPPFGGIGKNWYKLAYMRRFRADRCSGGITRADGKASRPGMLPESCSILKTSQDLSIFWQVPFDGDTERVVGYQFSTAQQMLPIASNGAKPSGFLQAPTFSFAQAEGRTTGMGNDNCIIVSLIPSVTIMSGSSKSMITIEGLMKSGTSDSDTLPLFSDDKCTSAFSTLKGSDGVATKNFQPVKGTDSYGSPDALLANYRPFGRAALNADGKTRARAITKGTLYTMVGTAPSAVSTPPAGTNAGGFGSDGYFDDADWHTRARTGTTTALTTGNPNNNLAATASTLKAATALASGKLVSPVGSLSAANGLAKFEKVAGKLTVALAPGYFLSAGELLVFSFKLQNNPGTEQASQQLAVSASGTYCDSGDEFCDGISEPSLEIKSVPVVGKGKILESKKAQFVTSTIYQASSDPDDLTTIFVTLRTNMDLKKPDATADSRITISGLDKCGFETGTNVQLYQNQKAGGLPLDNEYPTEAVRTVSDLPGLSTEDSSIISSAASYSGGILKIKLGDSGMLAEKDYAFAFQMQTSKVANSLCAPKISSSGGSQQIVDQAMSTSTLGVVMPPQFTTLKIGQVTTRPGVTNYLCVTLQHNYQFYTDAVVNQGLGATGNYIESKITISGLTGTQAVNGAAIPLAYCPTEVPYFDDKTTQHTSTQFQPDVTDFTPKRYATFGTKSCFGDSLTTQQCVPGNPYVPAGAFDTSVAGRSWFGGSALETKDTFVWNQATGTAILTVDAAITKERITEPQTVFGGIPKNSEIVFALPLQNGVAASGCKTVTFQSSGKIEQSATMIQTVTGKALQDGEVDGDACALKVYEPGFLVRQITQSTGSTGDDNVITVSLRTNVDLSSVANGQASYITISGLTGSATGDNADLSISAPIWKFSPKFEGNKGSWKQGDGTLVLKLDSGLCKPPTVWAAGSYGSTSTSAPFSMGGSDVPGTTAPSTCIKAGYGYAFTFTLVNPDSEQAAPSVSIQGVYRNADNVEVPIAKKAAQGPISNSPEKTALLVSNQLLTTYKIGQLVPAPGSINVICVTLKASKDIKSQANAPLSSITITGLTGFDASAQDLQLYKDDGVTKLTSGGGNPSKDNYKVGGIFSSQNSASGSTATSTNGFAASGLGFANYDGATNGNVVLWVQGETAPGDVYQYVQKNVEHKFCFRLKNPKSEMACKDVSVIVNNKGTISKVKAVQDTNNAIEYYKFGSTCAGYVAPPNFVVKNWRSSSNTTSATSIIHLELATNIELETGDTITVSGLTSFTKQCPTPPCDVGIDVTKTAVSMVFDKPYVNDVRGLKGFGSSDTGALSSDRVAFAKAIQSYDVSGTLNSGKTSTFGENAAWGKLGDTQASASTLTFTVAKDAKMKPADISYLIGTANAPSQPVFYEIVFALLNKATAVSAAPVISINIGKGQTQYVSLPVDSGAAPSTANSVKVCSGGLVITYTAMKTIYGGESLVLTLPKFTRDSNGMLFGVASAPNSAFSTYKSWQDWKAYGTDQKYSRAFFTNGWVADGYSAKSGDSGQTGERWNYPNVNAKVTTDADYNHDTGVLVLDINDPGIGQNKNYWYAATEDNLYEGRVTRAANDGAAVANFVGSTSPSSTTLPPTLSQNTFAGVAASVDYYLDNGEELKPVRAFAMIKEYDTATSSAKTYNSIQRPVAYLQSSSTAPATGFMQSLSMTNVYPAPVPSLVDDAGDSLSGTPPFKGIPSKYQPSRRDNFYKGMLMKCWVGTKATGGRLPYTESLLTGADNYLAATTTQKELLPPAESVPVSAFGRKEASPNFQGSWSFGAISTATFTIADATTTAATLDTADTAILPGNYYIITGTKEIIRVVAKDTVGTGLTIARGQLGTTPVASGAAAAQLEVIVNTQAAMTSSLATTAKSFAQADVSRTLETRVIQASFRQIDYVARKGGGCFVKGTVNKRALYASNTVSDPVPESNTKLKDWTTVVTTSVAHGIVLGQQVILPDGSVRSVIAVPSTTSITVDGSYLALNALTADTPILALEPASTIAAANCQDEVPGYPAVVRLESPFSRPLDPDTLCYIQRKADVGVYTGMTAMVGNNEYLIKQGAANIYTVGFVAADMKGPNGDTVDRKVPRSYSTENAIPANGKRSSEGFFSDGVGLSGQPYTIYSQLELVAKQGSKVSVGETITITLPSSTGIVAPKDMSGPLTPANTKRTIADRVRISHVLLVPLSPACSIVAAYGVSSGCQEGNGKGGVFDLILSDKWPYAYTSENGNDINGYSMTVFGGQATVIKSMADKYSQDLPYRPLEGLNAAVTTGVTGAAALFTDDAILNVNSDTLRNIDNNDLGGRGQKSAAGALAIAQNSAASAAKMGGASHANSLVDGTFTVARELDLLTLTGGSARADAHKMPKLPNAPITLVHGACGSKQADTLGPATLPYAVCMSLGDGVLAHSQNLIIADSVTNAASDACSVIGACTISFTAAPAAPATGLVIGVSTAVTVTAAESAKFVERETYAALLSTTSALTAVFRVDSKPTTTSLTVTQIYPGTTAVTNVLFDGALSYNVYNIKNPVVGVVTDAVTLSSVPQALQVTEAASLRPGMNVLITSSTYVFKAVARVEFFSAANTVVLTKVFPADFDVAAPATAADTDLLVPLPDGHAAMDALGVATTGVQAITGKVGQEQTPVTPHPLRDLYSMMGSARPVPSYGTVTGTYENPADNLGLGAFIVVGVYNNGTSDRFINGQAANKGTTKSAFPVANDMTNNLVIQRYLGTSRTTIPLADVESGYIGSNNLNKPATGFKKPAGQVPRYQARVAAGYAIGRFSYGVDNIMQVRSDMTSGAPATGTTIPQASILPGNSNMDGALAMSPYSSSVDLSASDGLLASILPLAANAARTLSAASDTDTVLTASGNGVAAGYYQVVQTGEIIQVTTIATNVLTTVRGALGSRAMPIPATANIRLVVVTAGAGAGIADFESTGTTAGVERTTGAAYATVTVGAKSLVNNKRPSGHTVDVTAPSTMQKIRFGRSTLPLPQVFHTAAHQAGSVGQANLLTRGTCGLTGANVLLSGVSTLPTMSATTGALEMCRTISSSTYNVGLPFSRNAYIEAGMDVYLVSSIFDTLIQRPEPLRKTATGMTEEGKTQTYPGAGHFVGGEVTLVETTGAFTAAARGATSLQHAGVAAAGLKVGDIIYTAAAAAAFDTVIQNEAMLITAINADSGAGALTVVRQYMNTAPTTVSLTATAHVAYIRRTNGGFPGGVASSSASSSLTQVRTVGQGIHSDGNTVAAVQAVKRNNQLSGNIQTTGTRYPRGGAASGAFDSTTIAAANNARIVGGGNVRGVAFDSSISSEIYNYGFDSDFRLYSVLGPFMRPAIIRDVIDTSKMSRSVLSSRFPGVLSINSYDSPSDLVDSGATVDAAVATITTITVSTSAVFKVGDYITAPSVVATAAGSAAGKQDAFVTGEIMLVTAVPTGGIALKVMRGALGTVPAAIGAVATRVFIIPAESRHNNGKYSLAPITGTSFATAATRATQYHTYAETDKVISFCNPLQSDLNNAPGSAIMSAIADDAVSTFGGPTVTQHSSAGSTIFANPLLYMRATTMATAAVEAATNTRLGAGTALTPLAAVTLATQQIFPGDYVAPVSGGVPTGEILRVVAFTAGAGNDFDVERGALGTTATEIPLGAVFWYISKAEVSRLTTQSTDADNKYASSNGKESTAPSLWTVPRRHHLCRKLITGAPELAAADVISDTYRTDNSNNEMYARSRYTESVQMNQVLNQDPSPNMRAMVTFVEPTKIAVSTECTASCEYSASGFTASVVSASCASFTLRSETFSVTFPSAFPHLATVSLKETAFASYAEFDAEKAASGIALSDRKLGLNTYNKEMFLGNFGSVGGIPDTNSASFTIKQTVNRAGALAGIDATARRRLLQGATCPAGFDARMLRVGSLLKTACDCPSVCGKAESECTTAAGGTWSTVNLLERVCKSTPSPYDPTGAIVGGVLGGFFGLLLIGLLVWFLCCRKPAPEPVGRAVAIEKPLAPVYLPQPYPMLPEQYVPMPMPILDATTSIVQPTGQPMLYSSFQGAPIMEAYPAQPGSYPAPYGVAPQVAYGI